MATARKNIPVGLMIETIPIYRSCLSAWVISARSFQLRLSGGKQMSQESRNTSLRRLVLTRDTVTETIQLKMTMRFHYRLSLMTRESLSHVCFL